MTKLVVFGIAIIFIVHIVAGQFCGPQLQDIPDPASDSCTAFFRCYLSRRYSLRCPAGQVFDFNQARCRSTNLVDCPLQLQRFQAPGVPHYLRPAGQTISDPRVEVRVIQVDDAHSPIINNRQFLGDRSNSGNRQRMLRTRRFRNRPHGAYNEIRPNPNNNFISRPVHRSPAMSQNARSPQIASPNGNPATAQRQHRLDQPISTNEARTGVTSPDTTHSGGVINPGLTNAGEPINPGLTNAGEPINPRLTNAGEPINPGLTNAGEPINPGLTNAGEPINPGLTNAGEPINPGLTNAGEPINPGETLNSWPTRNPEAPNPGAAMTPGAAIPGPNLNAALPLQ